MERCIAILRRRLEAQGDDKISFAAKRARELAAEDEGAGICADGYLEDLEKLTAADISSFMKICWHMRQCISMSAATATADRC